MSVRPQVLRRWRCCDNVASSGVVNAQGAWKHARCGHKPRSASLWQRVENENPLPQFGSRHPVDLLQFSGEALDQLAAILSNWMGLVKSSAEWRLTGL
jgi:hypothetical protein